MFKELLNLLKQIGIYGIGSVISPVISIIMLPIYTSYLTPEDYGVLALAGVVGILLSTVISLKIDDSLVRIYFSFKKKDERNEVVITALIFTFLFTLSFVIILLMLESFLAPVLFDYENSSIIYKLVIITPIFGVTQKIQLNTLRSEEKSSLYTFFTISGLILSFSMNIFFVVILEAGVVGILKAGLISNMIFFIFLLPYTIKGKKFSFSWKKLKEILNFGIPIIPTGIAAILLNLSDRYFIEHFQSTEQVGIYAIGYRIADFLGIIITKPFKTAWGVYMFKVADRPDTKTIYKNVLVYYFFVAIWAGLALSVFAKEGLIIITTPLYYSAYRIVPLVAFSHILFGMMNILVAGIHLKKKTKYIAAFFISGAIINLILNFILIPIWGIMGAAVATVLSFIYLNATYFWGSQRLYPIDHEFKRLFKILTAGVLLWIISVFISQLDNIALSIALKILLLLFFPIVLFAFKFYKKEELNKFYQLLDSKIKPSLKKIKFWETKK